MPPTLGNGKICYIEVPSADVAASAEFYRKVFGWTIRTRGDGSTSFDDGVGQVSGVFIKGRAAATNPGYTIYVMVDDMTQSIAAVERNGGKIVQPVGADAPEITAKFADPTGNVLGLYQEPVKK